MFVEPVDLHPLLLPSAWVELAALGAAWVCLSGVCAGACLLVAGRLGWLR